jgi:diguanylate cyclase
LTGLANRRRLEAEFRRLTGSELSLLLIDFDGLKAVNDTLGYDSGDQLVNAIGIALARLSQPDEFVVRLGGDEFVVVMSVVGRESASKRAEDVTAALDELALPTELAGLFHGASVGWATVKAAESPWDALRRAEVEMRSRKRRRKTDRDQGQPVGADRSVAFREPV